MNCSGSERSCARSLQPPAARPLFPAGLRPSSKGRSKAKVSHRANAWPGITPCSVTNCMHSTTRCPARPRTVSMTTRCALPGTWRADCWPPCSIARPAKSPSGFLPDLADAVACGGPQFGPQALTWSFTRLARFVDEAAEDCPALDPLPGEVCDGGVGAGRAQLECGQYRPVGPVQRGPRIASAQYGDLVPQHQQFRVLGRW